MSVEGLSDLEGTGWDITSDPFEYFYKEEIRVFLARLHLQTLRKCPGFLQHSWP